MLAIISVAMILGGGNAQSKDKPAGSNYQQIKSYDPYIWLEDIHGSNAMKWVKSQNPKSKGVLEADPDYQKDYDSILKVMDATDRIPFGNLNHNYVFNFWQDAQHPKGIWRRTTIAD